MRTCHILHLGIYDSNNCMLMFPLDMSSTLYFVLHPKLTLSFAFVFSFFFFAFTQLCSACYLIVDYNWLPIKLLLVLSFGLPLSYFFVYIFFLLLFLHAALCFMVYYSSLHPFVNNNLIFVLHLVLTFKWFFSLFGIFPCILSQVFLYFFP